MRWAQRTATLLAAGLLAGCGLFSPEPGARATGDAAVQKARALRELEGLRPGAHDLRAVPGLTAPALAPPPEMAAGRPRPDWVRTGVSAQFPPPVEVAGTGSCDRGRGNAYSALSTAEDRARVQVVEVVRERVRTQCDRVVRDLRASSEGESISRERYTRAAQEVIAQADLVLESVFIADRWYDPASDTYWALAAIDRPAAIEAAERRIRTLQASVEEDAATGTRLLEAKRTLEAAVLLSRAGKNAVTLLSLRAQRRALEPTREAAEGPLVTPQLMALWKAGMKAREGIRIGVLVCVEVDGKPSATSVAEAELTPATRDLGFTVTTLKSPWEMSFEETRSRALDDFRELAGAETDCLVLAGFSAREAATRKWMGILMHYYRAEAQALVLDLRSGKLAAAIGFAPEQRDMAGYFLDFVPQSIAFEPVARRAAESAVRQASQELARELRRTLAAAFHLSE